MELRDLQKMTVVKLREEALKHSSIAGVYAMDKGQLVAAMAEIHGIDVEAASKAAKEQFAADKTALKREIRAFKGQRDEGLVAQNAAQIKQARLAIKKRKRQLRRLVGTQTASV